MLDEATTVASQGVYEKIHGTSEDDATGRYRVTLTFLELLLGTVSKDPEVYKSFIQAKQAEAAKKAGIEITDEMLEDEAESVVNAQISDLEEKGWTGFMQTAEGQNFLYNYMLKGFFKEACSNLRRIKGTRSSKLSAHKKVIDGLIFITPRKLLLQIPPEEEITLLERPLRAQTAQGERVALARSDAAPAGSRVQFEIIVLGSVSQELLEEWLWYGTLKGLGQWRNGGYGIFDHELERIG